LIVDRTTSLLPLLWRSRWLVVATVALRPLESTAYSRSRLMKRVLWGARPTSTEVDAVAVLGRAPHRTLFI